MKQLRVQAPPIFNLRFRPEILAGDGNQRVEIKCVAAHEHVRHLLLLVRFVAHVGEDDQASTGRVHGGLGDKGTHRNNQRQRNQEGGIEC